MRDNRLVQKKEVFYDGSCGLCHFFVRFTITRMPLGNPFVFAPLQGERFSALIKQKKIKKIPDSVVFYDRALKKVYFKGEAIIHILKVLGGFWKLIAYVLSIIPLCAVNFFYDIVAKLRRGFFKKPKTACPIVPEKYKQFFRK